MREKSQILVSHTGNTSIFAFAAEIEYHAEMNRDNILPNWGDLPNIEYSTIIANMQISGYSENTSTIPISSNGVVQNEIQSRLSTQIANHECDKYLDLLNEGGNN